MAAPVPYITSEGTNLFVDVAGGGTPLVFVHGFGLDQRIWDAQAAEFATGHQVVRMDLRGHGRSARADRGHSYGGTARDVNRVLYQAGVERLNPGFVVAHSIAADAALQVALDEPRALRGVVLVAPAVWGQAWSAGWRDLWNAMRRDARAGDLASAFERFRSDEIFAGVRDTPGAWAAVRDMNAACTGAQLLSDERDDGVPTLERLAGCNVPLLVIAPRRDRDDFRRAAAAILATVPGALVREMDCGHVPSLEQPVVLNTLLQEFFAAHVA
jgi:3-oxoadipate enol-lactonase